MTPISPDEWAARIPWHAKAQILTALDQAIAQRNTDRTVTATLNEARRHLAARGPDPDAARHLRELLAETELPRDALGRILPKTARRLP